MKHFHFHCLSTFSTPPPPAQIHEEHPDNIESLQYLEALCKDLGRSHEEYSKKLEKLRRSQPSAAVTSNNGATQAGSSNEA